MKAGVGAAGKDWNSVTTVIMELMLSKKTGRGVERNIWVCWDIFCLLSQAGINNGSFQALVGL